MRFPAIPILLSCLALLAACSSEPVKKEVRGDAYESRQLIQSDANRLANLAMRDNLDSLGLLLEKFYKRNPGEWRKTAASLDEARKAVIDSIRESRPWAALGDKKSIQALPLAFDPEFAGDRAAALVYGLGSMLIEVYGGRTTLYLIHGLDAQKVSNAMANIEAVMWLLASRHKPDGSPLLFSNEIGPNGRNLSFEREFGRILGRLELLAELNDEKYRRAGINYLQGIVAGPFLQFLPVDAVSAAVQ